MLFGALERLVGDPGSLLGALEPALGWFQAGLGGPRGPKGSQT